MSASAIQVDPAFVPSMPAMLAEDPDFAPVDARSPEVIDAALVDDVFVASTHLLAWLKPDHPPFTASLADGFRHYHPKGTPMPNGRPSAAFDLWAGLRKIEQLRVHRTGKAGQAVASVALIDVAGDFVLPDEAVPVVSDPADAAGDNQPRLAGT